MTLKSREVKVGADGAPWTNQPDPVLRERLRETYFKTCETSEEGRQLVAVHQELVAQIDAVMENWDETLGNVKMLKMGSPEPHRSEGDEARS